MDQTHLWLAVRIDLRVLSTPPCRSHQSMPATRSDRVTPSALARSTAVIRVGSTAPRSISETCVRWTEASSPSASWLIPCFVRIRRTFAPKMAARSRRRRAFAGSRGREPFPRTFRRVAAIGVRLRFHSKFDYSKVSECPINTTGRPNSAPVVHQREARIMAARARLIIAALVAKDRAAIPDQPNGHRGRHFEVQFKFDAHAFPFGGSGHTTEVRTRSMTKPPRAELSRDANSAWFAARKNDLKIDREAHKHPAETRINPDATTNDRNRCRGSTAYVMSTPARSTAIEQAVGVRDSSTSRCRKAPGGLGGPYGCSSF